MFMIFGSKEAG